MQLGNLSSNLLFLPAVFTLQFTLVCVSHAAPAWKARMSDSELTGVVEEARSLVTKVLDAIPVVHGSCVTTQVSDALLVVITLCVKAAYYVFSIRM